MKSRLIKSVVGNRSDDYLANKDLGSYRVLCLIAAILISLFWFFHKLTNPYVVDFFIIRLFFSLFFLLTFLTSFISSYVKKNIVYLLEASHYAVTIWIIYLNLINKFSDHSIALIIITFGTLTLGFKRRIHLILYPLTVLILTTLACFLIENSHVNKGLFISNLASISLISYVFSNSRLNIQEEIAIKEQFMTTIFDDSADALILVNPITQEILNCNDYAISLFDKNSKEEILGFKVDISEKIRLVESHKFDLQDEIKKYGILCTQLEYITKKRKKIWIDLVIKEIKIVDESILLVRVSDITQIKQAEEALQEANDDLERRVEERTAELLKSNMLLKQQISDRKRAEEKLVHSAFHDALTSMPNRTLFMDRLEHAVARAKRHQDYLFAVLFLDLDRFKVVNDSLGHMIGDQLLLAITKRIKTCLRSVDTLARIGGDEFTILLDGIKDVSDAKHVANRIQEELMSPFNLSGHEVFTSTSIGIALSSKGYTQPEQLLRDADTAMYQAKIHGKARYEVFDISMHASAKALLQLETDLRRAIERQEFRLHYQPIVSLKNTNIIGFEALVRWQHPDRGLILPAEFIPVAEETGLIIAIGLWVLREACCQMQLWQQQFPANLPLTISVNVSGRQFSQPDLSEQIKQLLHETNLDPRTLKLELTESAIMENTEAATVMLSQLRKLGVQLHMDDFGTGYSSLSYLQRFPMDMLKIDRSFVSRIVDNENSEIVKTIMTLAHNLGMKVTAEGVETTEQLTILKAFKCEYGQGHLFSPSVDSLGATELLAADQRL